MVVGMKSQTVRSLDDRIKPRAGSQGSRKRYIEHGWPRTGTKVGFQLRLDMRK